MFDLRSMEHSTIIYESSELTPLLRLTWNKQDPNYLATILLDSQKTVILDIRVSSVEWCVSVCVCVCVSIASGFPANRQRLSAILQGARPS